MEHSSDGDAGWRVSSVPAAATHGLRRTVLRNGTPVSTVTYDGDDDADTVHLAVLGSGGVIVAVSTWLLDPFPGEASAAVRLRGMATMPEHRGEGHGSRLLAAGIEHARTVGTDTVWANARDTALGFYLLHGFEVASESTIDETTALPHLLVRKQI